MKTNIHFFIMSHSFLLKMKNVPDKNGRENQNTHFVFSTFFVEKRALYEKMWRNIVERGRPQMTIWCMPIVCWIHKATNTHTQVL